MGPTAAHHGAIRRKRDHQVGGNAGKEIDVEAIIGLQPDLITTKVNAQGSLNFDEAFAASLRSIAPLLAFEHIVEIEPRLDYVAALLNADSPDLERERQEYSAVVEEFRALLGDRWPR